MSPWSLTTRLSLLFAQTQVALGGERDATAYREVF